LDHLRPRPQGLLCTGQLNIHSSLLNVVLHDEPHQQLSDFEPPPVAEHCASFHRLGRDALSGFLTKANSVKDTTDKARAGRGL